MKIRKRLILAIILLMVAGLLYYMVGFNSIDTLPPHFVQELTYAVKSQFRESPEAEWNEYVYDSQRTDQTLLSQNGISIIQGEVLWITKEGKIIYESSGLYGVNLQTRANVPGYGDLDRQGQYLFPAHTQKTRYTLWDQYYFGPVTAEYQRTEIVDGLELYLFDFVANRIDDTYAYQFLSTVPERYRTESNGRGKLWVEPVSGIVVDFEDAGTTSFVDQRTGEKVADFFIWEAKYTDEIRAEQFRLARQFHLWILLVCRWTPSFLVMVSLICIASIFRLPNSFNHRRSPITTQVGTSSGRK